MDKIIINDLSCFNIRQILDCGQIFRYHQQDENTWIVYSLDKKAIVKEFPDRVEIECEDKDYFINYFDLNTDYNIIKEGLKDKPLMKESIEYGYGIRILKQDKWEMLISFIVSANNHIPRIKSIIERICDRLGKDMGDYHAFPTPQAMASVDQAFYKELGAGYRDKYLIETAKAVAGGFDLEEISNMNAEQANKRLCTLMGVGPKVADCILLFGYHKQDVFPVDTWVKKIYKDVTGKQEENNKKIRNDLLNIYGENAGYAQQYLFFNKRDNS